MASARSPGTGAKVTISHPLEIDGEWEYMWFDAAHQHFLLLNESYFYLFSFAEASARLFANCSELPVGLMDGKVSLDKRLIAVQASLTEVLVLDVVNKKRWRVEIRSPSDNSILSGGVVWSEHGGNSQDLVIATCRGLELHKVSVARNQCKESRHITQPASHCWYNPRHRCMLLAAYASPRGRSTSKNTHNTLFLSEQRRREMLLIDGVLLNCATPSIPMLELPPPERIPRFEVGPGLTTDDVSLQSLYGRLFCLVRYSEHGRDFITLYHLTKTAAQRTHCLALNGPTSGLLYSVYDHLLLCHCVGERATVIFDIRAPARTRAGVAGAVTWPLGSGDCMHYLHKHSNHTCENSLLHGEGEGEGTRLSSWAEGAAEGGDEMKGDGIQQGQHGGMGGAGQPRSMSLVQQLMRESTVVESTVVEQGMEGMEGMGGMVLGMGMGMGMEGMGVGGMVEQSMVAECSFVSQSSGYSGELNDWEAVTPHKGANPHIGAYSAHTLHASPHTHAGTGTGARTGEAWMGAGAGAGDLFGYGGHGAGYEGYGADVRVFGSLSFQQTLSLQTPHHAHGGNGGGSGNGYGGYGYEGEDRSVRTASASTHPSIDAQFLELDAPEPAPNVYSTYTYEYLSEGRLLDSHRRVVWEVRVSVADVAAQMDSQDAPLFLGNRGLRFFDTRQSSQGILYFGFHTLEARVAKQQLLCLLYGLLERGGDLGTLKRCLGGLMKPYAREYRRLVGVRAEALLEAGGGGGGSGGGISGGVGGSSGGGSSGRGAIGAMGVGVMGSIGAIGAGIGIGSGTGTGRGTGGRRLSVSESLFGGSGGTRLRLGPRPPLSPDGANTYAGEEGVGVGGVGGGGAGVEGGDAGVGDVVGGVEFGAGGLNPAQLAELRAMEGDPLEPAGACGAGGGAGGGVGSVHSLLPDITCVGLRALKVAEKTQAWAEQPTSTSSPAYHSLSSTHPHATHLRALRETRSPPSCQVPPLGTRRCAQGVLICSQTELLSHMWLPLLLDGRTSLHYLAWALGVFITHLQEVGVSVIPALGVLLLHLLFHSARHLEVAAFLQLGAFPDSAEVALTALEFGDILQDRLARPWRQGGGVGAYTAHTAKIGRDISANTEADDTDQDGCALRRLRLCALDMLWRVGERAAVVRWHLGRGQLRDAMELCSRRRNALQLMLPEGAGIGSGMGMGQGVGHGLGRVLPGSLSGLEFFLCATKILAGRQQQTEQALRALLGGGRSGDGLQRKEGAVDAGDTDAGSGEMVCALRLRAAAAAASSYAALLTDTLHGLLLFLGTWDRPLLASGSMGGGLGGGGGMGVGMGGGVRGGRSLLSAQVPFPDHLFRLAALAKEGGETGMGVGTGAGAGMGMGTGAGVGVGTGVEREREGSGLQRAHRHFRSAYGYAEVEA